MRRRDWLRTAAGAAFIGCVQSVAPAAPSPVRRVRPGDAGWPAGDEWERLKVRVGGVLVEPTSPLAPCEADAKSAVCRARFKDLQNPFFIGDQAEGTQVSGYLDAWKPAPSAYVVAARTAADVAEAVNFARRHNLRLVVKGGAHSYHGTSNAPDSLLVWMRPMRGVTVIDAFTPRGAPASQAPVPAVAAEGGAIWIDLYDAVTTRGGRYVQGGGCTTVGVAGHVQSGGFGSFSKGFGLSSANLLEAEVVTADGRIRTVNAYRDPDLFWGLKGGGGGSLGVVTRVVLHTHDLPAVFGGAGARIKASGEPAFRRLVARFLGFYAQALMNPGWGEQASIQKDNLLKISMVSQGVGEAQAAALWAPFFDWVKASPADYAFVRGPFVYAGDARDWWDVEGMRRDKSDSMHYDDRPGAPTTHGWWSGDQDQVGTYLHGYDSIWLPADLLAPVRLQGLADTLVDASRHMNVDLHFNKGLAGAPPEVIAAARDTAMHPGVLSAFALAIVATGGLPAYMKLVGLEPDSAFAHRNAAAVAASAAMVRRLAPDAGTYLSESDYFNADWRRAYWGSNHPRLAGVKAKYDPQGLFFVHHGVGSEAWSADGFQRL
jgi:FAD/FMN-containing dehydrogenase